MPLFTGRGFSGAAQQGFQQGFAQIVQTLMQDRAAAIQKDLEAQRLDAQAKMQKQESADRMALANKQIQAEGAKTRYTEGMANNRLERELLFRENANSQASTDATANRLSDQLFQSGEAAKTRDANATTEQNRLQMERDAAARQERQFGEKMALDAKQFDVTTGLQKEQQSFARERATKDDAFRAAEVIGKAIERKDANIQRLVDHATQLYAGGHDSVLKALATRASDTANPNAAADLADLKKFASSGPEEIMDAARETALKNAMDEINNSDDPSIAILKDLAPEAVKKALDAHLKERMKPKDEPKPEPEKTRARTDLGPLDVGPRARLAETNMTAEQRSAATRGAKSINVGGRDYEIEAPPDVKEKIGNLEPSSSTAATRWAAFTANPKFDEYVLSAFNDYKKMFPPGPHGGGYKTIDQAMASGSARKIIVRDAYRKFKSEYEFNHIP